MPGRDNVASELPVLEWLGCVPVCRCCGTINVYLTSLDGTRVRFKMTPDGARELIIAIEGTLHTPPSEQGMCPQCGVQSSRSSGNPQSAGSPQEGHVT